MESQDENVIVFENLISHSAYLRGEKKPITAKAFTQGNATGELKAFKSLDDIASVARTSGQNIVNAFSDQ